MFDKCIMSASIHGGEFDFFTGTLGMLSLMHLKILKVNIKLIKREKTRRHNVRIFSDLDETPPTTIRLNYPKSVKMNHSNIHKN